MFSAQCSGKALATSEYAPQGSCPRSNQGPSFSFISWSSVFPYVHSFAINSAISSLPTTLPSTTLVNDAAS